MNNNTTTTTANAAPDKTAATIEPGDVIMPPERELRLWMRRHIEEKNLPESALYLHVLTIGQSADKRGPWLIIKTKYSETWPGGSYAFTFKARPETPWKFISKANGALAL